MHGATVKTSSQYLYRGRVSTVWQVVTSDNCLSITRVVGMVYLVFITKRRKILFFCIESRPTLAFTRPPPPFNGYWLPF